MDNNFTITVTGPDGKVCQVLSDEIRAYFEALGLEGAVLHRAVPLEERTRVLAARRPRVSVTTMDPQIEIRKRTVLTTAVAKMESYKRQDLPERGAKLLDLIEGDQYPHLSSVAFIAACRERGLGTFVQACRRRNKQPEHA
ncbi:hypothetical protein D3C71_77250 [compost metagenome]